MMNEEIPILDFKYKNPEDVIREGIHSETLRKNPAFVSAVRNLYWQYTEAEDVVTAGNSGDAGKNRYHYSMMRLILTDLIRQLDGMIQAGDNAKYDKESYGSEEK